MTRTTDVVASSRPQKADAAPMRKGSSSALRRLMVLPIAFALAMALAMPMTAFAATSGSGDVEHARSLNLAGERVRRQALLGDFLFEQGRIVNDFSLVGVMQGQGDAEHLDDGELESLPPYTEERVYRLDWGGLFRKHPEWKEEA